MEGSKMRGIGMFFSLMIGSIALSESSSSSVCPVIPLVDLMVSSSRDSSPALDLDLKHACGGRFGVMEVDEASLHKALNLIHKNPNNYVALLFYASWCPFSKQCTQIFGSMSNLFPTIHHIAVEESSLRPSMLSRYGVHGFPTLFLQNSTMRIRYRGPRVLSSLETFYTNFTGIRPLPYNVAMEELMEELRFSTGELGSSCPYSWAKSPSKLLPQEMYLTLAISFLVLRLLVFLLPRLFAGAKWLWTRHMREMRIIMLWYRLQTYLAQAALVFRRICCSLKLCKGSNLQGGAMNARAWASKSLASVAISEGSSSSRVSVGH